MTSDSVTGPTRTAHDFSFPGISGGTIDLGLYAGRPVLVVNTASQCGLTPHYAGLEALWRERGPQGLVVVGVPSNDFGGQEPGTESEVKSFCETRFGVTFPMTAKQTIVGEDAHPFYRWLVATVGADAAPRWNFHKVLIGPDGAVAEIFGSRTPPEDPTIRAALDRLGSQAEGL